MSLVDGTIKEYQKRAQSTDPMVRAGRGKKWDPVSFLHHVHEVIVLLDLSRDHDILDVGCANGLLDIVLSACCKSLLAVEPVEEIRVFAQQNLRGYQNVEVREGHAAALPARDHSVDRLLLSEVIQLVPPKDIAAVFTEIHRVVRPGGRVLLASVPNAHHRDTYLTPYMEELRRATHLTENQREEILDGHRRTYWYTPEEFMSAWERLGCRAVQHAVSASHPHADHRFHLVVDIQK